MLTTTPSNIDNYSKEQKNNIDNYLKEQKNNIDNHLKIILEDSKFNEPGNLWKAVKYSLLDGGKRIRATLCLAAYESFSENSFMPNDCLTVACAIEMIHAMSLIHDDLPCMDNDDFRRGKPSSHKTFGEANAILAGDAMLTLAFNLIIDNTKNISNIKKLNLVNTLAKAFSFGLVPGQVLDLYYSKNITKNYDLKFIESISRLKTIKSISRFKTIKSISRLKTIESISRLKTAELIQASLICGAMISLNDENKENIFYLDILKDFGHKLGIAFQIIDDILDLTCDTKTLGKTSGKDMKQNKSTFPSILGIEKSKNMASDLISKAKAKLKELPLKTNILESLADYILNRVN